MSTAGLASLTNPDGRHGHSWAVPFPTLMGSSLFLLGMMLYLASMQGYGGLLLLILGLLFGLYVLNAWLAARSCLRVQVATPGVLAGTEGERLTDAWEVANDSRHEVGHVRLHAPFGDLLHVGLLQPQERTRRRPDWELPARGVYPLQHMQLESTYPFGLMRARRLLHAEGELVVRPRVYDCPAPPAGGFAPMVGGLSHRHTATAAGGLFHGVRPHRPGDPLRSIHWASSAKGQGMMVKECDEELSGRVGLLLDPATAVDADSDEVLHQAARAAASLTLAALDAGHHVAFLVIGAGQHEPVVVPPFDDGDVVLDLLARVRTRPPEDDRHALAQAIERLPRRSSICLLTTRADEPAFDRVAFEHDVRARPAALYLPAHTTAAAPATSLPTWYYDANGLSPAFDGAPT